ncbi:RagB/SusD family nutrient uptake outer membrane protein [Chitinophaga sp.]|uniref:RagB/SusD family nutrient uptake outer membrane protein n=1 Tax=Chitinophaga sp. TaxID=1869181 RepID=UPI002CB7BE91|nr:RagB/SusD family nutrient uptake outer membrane protein [Chitinophaga sp.]HWV67352.1 RagB/SusD family nutrient uptake outer membrane protein [Chitinophaga sp.]
MKTALLHKTGFTVLLLCLCTSCSKLLDETPKSAVTENFYNTPAEVEAAVNAIFTPLRSTNMSVYEATLECQSDYANGRGSWAPLHEFQGLNDANITRVSGLWNAFYLAIRNANLVTGNAPNGNAISKTDADRFIAEAKFMRAFCYFQLVRNWGGVPLRTEENIKQVDLKKSTAEEVYNFILSDLDAAETSLPEKPSSVGRPSKWAAKTLLADVYLQLGKYAEARDKADEVIKSNQFSMVPITSKSDFQNKVAGPELLSTSEEIFYLKYMRQAGQGNYMLWITNHPNTKLFNFGGSYVLYGDETSEFFSSWDSNDLRKALWDKLDIGLGAHTLISSRYTDTKAASKEGAGNDDPVYSYADALLIYAEASCRAGNAPTAAGMEALNQVRRRAYGKAPGMPSETDLQLADYNAATFTGRVLQERAYEFQISGKRWLDLKRSGTAKAVILAATGKTIAEKHYLWPIPLSEMNYNKALDPAKDQNPGY